MNYNALSHRLLVESEQVDTEQTLEFYNYNKNSYDFYNSIIMTKIFVSSDITLIFPPVRREARQSHVQLIKDQKLYEQKIGELEQKCKDMMMMKFGRMIDLEKLEGVTVNRNLEELKEKMRINDVKHARRMQVRLVRPSSV